MAFSGFDFWEGSGLEMIDGREILDHSGKRKIVTKSWKQAYTYKFAATGEEFLHLIGVGKNGFGPS